MKKFVAATVVLLGVAACSSGKDTYTPPPRPPSVSASSSNPAVHVPSKQVLDLNDLPTGWSVARKVGDQLASLPPCFRAATSTKGAKKVAHAYFAQGGTSPVLVQTLAYYPHTAAKTFASATKKLGACGKLKYKAKKIKVTGDVSATSFPRVGDDSSAYTANLHASGIALSLFLIIVRRDTEVLTLSYGVPGSGDISLLAPIATTAVDKLHES